MRVNASMACWPGMRHETALGELLKPISEPALGEIHVDHVQIVPQCMGVFDEQMAAAFKRAMPQTQFRLHANVRCQRDHTFYDLSNLWRQAGYFKAAALVSGELGAPAYSAHAGRRENCTLGEVFDNAVELARWFGCPVAIEGGYPDKGRTLHVDCWEEYSALLSSGVPFALDLSHLNIVAYHFGRDDQLVWDMLRSPQCIEVHVSDNDGTGDWHQTCDTEPWWFPMLQSSDTTAVIFTEGNQRRKRNATTQA